MAKTILEDISAFLAQQTSWVAGLPYDIQRLYQLNTDTILFVKEQLQSTINNTESKLYELQLDKDAVGNKLDNFIIDYDKTLASLKTFISSHKGEFLIELKKLYTRIEKEHNWVNTELTGAAADRVDIRQELGYEISKRRSQDNALNTKIESEILDRISKQDQLKSDLEASIATTNINVSSLDAKISAETLSRTNSITTLTQALANEAIARDSADITLANDITTVSNNVNVEAATRLANDTQLQNLIVTTKNSLQNSVSEIETRRISDLSILAARDNLEEDESKKRDYLLLQELRNIFSVSLNTETDAGGTAPLLGFSNGIRDWDLLASSIGTANTTSMATSTGSDKHGLLSNTIRKLNELQKVITGATGDVYDTTPVMDTGSNDNVGLDYWQGSRLRTQQNYFKWNDGTTEREIIQSNNTELKIAGSSYDSVNILGNEVKINSLTHAIEANSTLTATLSSCEEFSINTSTGVMKAYMFEGIATKALYADLAERYLADDSYSTGTVMGIGGDKEITLYKAGMPLAGVISTNPAFRMNDYSGSHLGIDKSNYEGLNPFIALKGRIPVKVMSNDIKKGDYVLALDGGMAYGVERHHLPADYQLRLIGIALSDADDYIVEVKI